MLTRLDTEGLDEYQMAFSTIFYWAAYLPTKGQDMIDMFIKDLGFSPFVGFLGGLSPVVAAIISKNYDTFQQFVLNSSFDLPKVHIVNGEIPGDKVS